MQHGNSPSDRTLDEPRTPAVVPLAHGLFMSAAGLWPLLHLRSFEAVTGPKRDKWLVRSVGAILTSIGAALVADGLRGAPSRGTRVLGIGSALALGGADVIYSAKGTISKVYLLDAVIQAGFLRLWLRQPRSRATTRAPQPVKRRATRAAVQPALSGDDASIHES